jgi:hypothetical protein
VALELNGRVEINQVDAPHGNAATPQNLQIIPEEQLVFPGVDSRPPQIVQDSPGLSFQDWQIGFDNLPDPI